MAAETKTVQSTDTELMIAISRGDEKSFSILYDRYSSILFGLLIRIVQSRSEAEDLLQEVFLQSWQRCSDFDEQRGKPFTWLVTIARSRAIDRLRALKSRNKAVAGAARDLAEDAAATVIDPVHQLVISEDAARVRNALSQISDDQRSPLLMAYFAGLSQSEIAAATGEPLGTVKTRMRAGLLKLRDLLRNDTTPRQD